MNAQSYQASQIRRYRATKAEVQERRKALFDIIEASRPMTVRQVFYQASVRRIVEKAESGYTKIQTDLTLLRRAGELPYDWLADNTRWQRKPNTFDSIEDELQETARFYRKALWKDIDAYVEIWLEKDALSGVIYPVTSLYDVPLMVARGYPRFWQWRAEMVQIAMLERRIESVFGWPLHISISPNQRTLYNFPMQSGGAEILRLATMRLCDAGIVPIMLIHDGILFEETDAEKIEHAKEIMRSAGRDTCDGLEIGVDVDQLLENGARYCDKRPMAQAMWATIMNVMQAVKAIPAQAVA